jgi:hypothetical protein
MQDRQRIIIACQRCRFQLNRTAGWHFSSWAIQLNEKAFFPLGKMAS